MNPIKPLVSIMAAMTLGSCAQFPSYSSLPYQTNPRNMVFEPHTTHVYDIVRSNDKVTIKAFDEYTRVVYWGDSCQLSLRLNPARLPISSTAKGGSITQPIIRNYSSWGLSTKSDNECGNVYQVHMTEGTVVLNNAKSDSLESVDHIVKIHKLSIPNSDGISNRVEYTHPGGKRELNIFIYAFKQGTP